MLRNKLVGVGVAALALAAGPLAVAPAHAQNCDKINEPYNYPCDAARAARAYAVGQLAETLLFVDQLRYEVGEVAVQVVCTVFPENCL